MSVGLVEVLLLLGLVVVIALAAFAVVLLTRRSQEAPIATGRHRLPTRGAGARRG